MKSAKLALAAFILAAAPLAQAIEVWTATSNSGGKIVITSRACPDEAKLRSGYAVGSGGRYQSFCWVLMDGMIHAVYKDGKRYVYDPSNFERSPASSDPKKEG